MPRDHIGARPGFRIHSQSIYADSIGLEKGFDEIMVGFYDDHDGEIGEGGTSGEFAFVWYMLGDARTIRLECYSDGWSSLVRIPRLLNLMNDLDSGSLGRQNDPSVEEFAELLISIGVLDMTKRSWND